MCKLREKKDAKKPGRPVTGWEIEGKARGRIFTIYFGARNQDKHTITIYRGLVDKLEKELRTRGVPYEGTIDEVKHYPELYRRLIDRGVIDAPAAEFWTLKQLERAYIEAGHKEGKAESTLRNQSNSLAKLRAYLGDETTLDGIDEEAARAFADSIDEQVAAGIISTATRAGYIRDNKRAFNWARAEGIVAANPFGDIKKGSFRNEARKVYSDLERARAVLEACRNSDRPLEWRALFALARFQGLRVPSETRALRWQDVDFGARQITITSQKTKNYIGKDKRVMPLFAPTAEILKELRKSQPRGQTFIFAELLPQMRMESNLRTGFLRILARAGLDPWTKPFANLRASAATDIAAQYGGIAESRWIGHSERVAEEHYLQILPTAQNDDKGLFSNVVF